MTTYFGLLIFNLKLNLFSENEGLSSGCEASGVRQEIARDYAALQSRLRREFSDRRGKLYAGELSFVK